MIETRLLQQFIAVAEELHFNRAAERLHMAQSPLSQAIRRLESEIGYPLFERSNRRVALTAAGHSFLKTAQHTLQILDQGVAQTRRVAQGVEGHLSLTFINIAPYAVLLGTLRQFRQRSPNVEFSMIEATTHEQVKALEQGTVDIAFMRTPGTTTPHLCFETILRERICVALPVGHHLQAESLIALELLKDEAFVASARPLGQGFHDQLIGLCLAAGFQPRIVQQARRLQTLIALVASGAGIALVPDSLVIARDDVVFRPLQVDAPDALLYLDLLMAWNVEQHSPLRDRLIESIRLSIAP